MKTRQRSIRVFEIITDDYEKLVKFVSKRLVTLKKHLLLIKTKNEHIKDYFNKSNLEYIIVDPDFKEETENIEEKKENNTHSLQEQAKVEEKTIVKTEIYDRIIRGGEEINSNNKLIFLKRINPGARIISSESIEIFDEVEGTIICNGEYMIVKKNNKGTIIFNDEDIKIDKLSFVTKDGIKEL
jgi:septum site-determining protein MinC